METRFHDKINNYKSSNNNFNVCILLFPTDHIDQMLIIKTLNIM